jgi:HK97 family phage major capsid protein
MSSVFFELLAEDYFRKIPLRTRAVVTTAGATGFVRGEGSARTISRLSFDSTNGLAPREAAAVVVVSNELLKLAGSGAQALFTRELRAAVGAVVDDEFMTIVAAAKAQTYASAGSTFNAARNDLYRLLNAISTDANSRLCWIGGTTVAKVATTLADNGNWSFPAMTPEGGIMLGMPFYVTDQIAADTLYLVDAHKIAAAADTVSFDMFRQALLQLNDAPDSPETTSSVQISLWQEGLVALIARTFFAAEAVNATCIAELTGVAWGSFGVDSPT